MNKDNDVSSFLQQYGINTAQPWWAQTRQSQQASQVPNSLIKDKNVFWKKNFYTHRDPIKSLDFYKIILLLTSYQQSWSWYTQKSDDGMRFFSSGSHAVSGDFCFLCWTQIWWQCAWGLVTEEMIPRATELAAASGRGVRQDTLQPSLPFLIWVGAY